ncbi:MAG: MGMT family protein [Patescibacteria group bacterium]
MTLFQMKVYAFVGAIPKGKIATYKEVAVAIGYPKAYRAVGNALNKNPYMGEVPCHRVVRSNGGPGGYVLGTEKKIQLLLSEKVKLE